MFGSKCPNLEEIYAVGHSWRRSSAYVFERWAGGKWSAIREERSTICFSKATNALSLASLVINIDNDFPAVERVSRGPSTQLLLLRWKN